MANECECWENKDTDPKLGFDGQYRFVEGSKVYNPDCPIHGQVGIS